MLTQAQLESLLNRPLTTAEVTNLSTYLDIATEQLSTLLCFIPEVATGIPSDRLYEVREGYRTIYTAPFVGTPVVTVDGVVQTTDTYSIRQFDNLNGTWFNSIVFKCFLSREIDTVTITADWGFTALPADLSLLLVKLFDIQSINNTGSWRVKRKDIEDFRVIFSDIAEEDKFLAQYTPTINRYNLCSISNVQHGDTYDSWETPNMRDISYTRFF